jgi:hypothetical protein
VPIAGMRVSFGLNLTAVISLALGIGATTAVFSVIYGGLKPDQPISSRQLTAWTGARSPQDGRAADPPPIPSDDLFIEASD